MRVRTFLLGDWDFRRAPGFPPKHAFAPLGSAPAPIKPEAIGGYIELVVDEEDLIGPDFWGDLDDHWPFLVDYALRACRGERVEERFPDFDVALIIAPRPDGRLAVTRGAGDTVPARTVVVGRDDFAGAIGQGALDFYEAVKRSNPKAAVGDAGDRAAANALLRLAGLPPRE